MLINTLSKKYIGSTTTNHGADMAISRRTDIQHDGHSQAFPRYKRRSADKRWTAHIVYTYTPPTQGTTHKTQLACIT